MDPALRTILEQLEEQRELHIGRLPEGTKK